MYQKGTLRTLDPDKTPFGLVLRCAFDNGLEVFEVVAYDAFAQHIKKNYQVGDDISLQLVPTKKGIKVNGVAKKNYRPNVDTPVHPDVQAAIDRIEAKRKLSPLERLMDRIGADRFNEEMKKRIRGCDPRRPETYMLSKEKFEAVIAEIDQAFDERPF